MGRLQAALERWRGTPYVHGWSSPGQGVDCWNFLGAVIDEATGLDRRPRLTLPAGAGFHRPDLVARQVGLFLRAYEPLEVACGDRRPGTVLLEAPAHAIIVGADGCLWDAAPHGVRAGGDDPALVIRRAWRLPGTEDWAS